MAEFTEQHLDDSRFERVSLRRASFTQVHLTDATFRDVDLSGTRIRDAYLDRVRLSGVEIPDLEISGEVVRLVVNGVDVAPLVEAELDRRLPERALMRPTDPEGFRTAFDTIDRLWAGTIDRARRLPPDALHERVDDEWSFTETLRHLSFAHALWVDGMIRGNPFPWHPLDLPWDEAPVHEGIPWDREARPSLDEVLTLRRQRRATVEAVLDGLTPEGLAEARTSPTPFMTDRDGTTVAECLRVVLNEEWHHRLYAERDLDALEHQEN